MTTLNTIIEEEKKIIEMIDHETAVKWGEHSDVYIDWRDKLKEKVKCALATAMQRAYEAGRADWLRREIEKLEGMKKDERTMMGEDIRNMRKGRNVVIQTIITRYKEELLELEKGI